MTVLVLFGCVGCAAAPQEIELANAMGKEDLSATSVMLTHEPTTFVIRCDKWFGHACDINLTAKPTATALGLVTPLLKNISEQDPFGSVVTARFIRDSETSYDQTMWMGFIPEDLTAPEDRQDCSYLSGDGRITCYDASVAPASQGSEAKLWVQLALDSKVSAAWAEFTVSAEW